jgi:putative tryptophan/tyrosine transport system substrate-binding protein
MTIGIRQQPLGNSKKLKLVPYALCAMLFAICAAAQAQQAKKVPRIGYLTASPLSAIAPRIEAFRQGLRELEYVEGKNVVIEWRAADGKLDRVPALAAELVRLKVNVIVTGGAQVTRLAKQATVAIPIVMAQDRDPVGEGFVASLARPGGEHHRIEHAFPGDRRKATGASERDRSQTLPCCRTRDFK